MINYTQENGIVRLFTYFRHLNRITQRNPWPMPKIQYSLDAIGGFQFTTIINLNICQYTMMLGSQAPSLRVEPDILISIHGLDPA